MNSCGPLHMDEQSLDVQFKPSYSSSVPIPDVALRICRKQWTIGRCGEGRSGISVLIVRHDDDYIYVYIYVYIYIYICVCVCVCMRVYNSERETLRLDWFS